VPRIRWFALVACVASAALLTGLSHHGSVTTAPILSSAPASSGTAADTVDEGRAVLLAVTESDPGATSRASKRSDDRRQPLLLVLAAIAVLTVAAPGPRSGRAGPAHERDRHGALLISGRTGSRAPPFAIVA
jgi:hypothetical protein